MKKVINIRALLILFCAMGASSPAYSASLLEIYQQALQSDPQIHEAEARRLAALEAKPQARSAYLPQISANGNYTTSDRSGPIGIFDTDTGERVIVDADIETDLVSWDVTLRQTLFRWDQIVGLRQADKTVAKAERFDVGLIAITAVQESQAADDNAVANEIAAKRSLATAREFLREITGEYVSELSAPTEDFPLITPDPSDEASWVNMSLTQNLTLMASRIDEQLARDQIALVRTGHYPTLDLVANTSEDETDQTTTTAFGTTSDSLTNPRDSISLQLSVPIFSGGGTSSRVREAVYLHRAAREQLQRVTRETERQARDAYLGFVSERSRVKALEQAVASSRTALQATEAGFEVGTRTIVDVLNSQFTLYQAITNYYQSRYDYVLNALRLKQAAGNLAVQDLERIDQHLEKRKTPEQLFADEAKAETASE